MSVTRPSLTKRKKLIDSHFRHLYIFICEPSFAIKFSPPSHAIFKFRTHLNLLVVTLETLINTIFFDGTPSLEVALSVTPSSKVSVKLYIQIASRDLAVLLQSTLYITDM